MPRFVVELFLEDINTSTGPYEYQNDGDIHENMRMVLYETDDLNDAITKCKELLEITKSAREKDLLE